MGLTSFVRHADPARRTPPSRGEIIKEAIRRSESAGTCSSGNLGRWKDIVREVEEEMTGVGDGRVCNNVKLANSFFEVYVDLCTGVGAVYDIAAKTNYSLTHDLMRWPTNNNQAYAS